MARRDLRLDIGFLRNAKVMRLRNDLGERGVVALLGLWVYAAEHAPADGALRGLDRPQDVEAVAGWRGSRGLFHRALIDFGLVDEIDGLWVVHDWAEEQPWLAGSESRSSAARRAAEAKYGGRPGVCRECAAGVPHMCHAGVDAHQSAERTAEEAKSAKHGQQELRGACAAHARRMRGAENRNPPSPSPSPSPIPREEPERPAEAKSDPRVTASPPAVQHDAQEITALEASWVGSPTPAELRAAIGRRRQSGKISDGAWLSVLRKAQPFSAEIRALAASKYLELEDKGTVGSRDGPWIIATMKGIADDRRRGGQVALIRGDGPAKPQPFRGVRCADDPDGAKKHGPAMAEVIDGKRYCAHCATEARRAWRARESG